MRNILTSAAFAVLSIFFIASPANAQAGIKNCRDFHAARGGWVSPTCTSEELTAYLSANGFAMAPIPSTTTTYTSVSPE